MNYFHRFGRRIPVPSSLQVSRELRQLSRDEDSRTRCAEADGLPSSAGWDEIVARRKTLALKDS